MLHVPEGCCQVVQQTKGVLVGVVETENNGTGNISISLEISVPALNDYRYRILSYHQPLELYPGLLTPLLQETSPHAKTNSLLQYAQSPNIPDEATFISAVKEIISSARVRRVLTALLAQVRMP